MAKDGEDDENDEEDEDDEKSDDEEKREVKVRPQTWKHKKEEGEKEGEDKQKDAVS